MEKIVAYPQMRDMPMGRSTTRVLLPAAQTKTPGNFLVVILDNNTNTYEQVIKVCMDALGITYREAFQIAVAVDNNGRAEVFQGTRDHAEAVATIIRTIGIEVLVIPTDQERG